MISLFILSKEDKMFLNRRAELDLLEKHFASSNAELFVLYGRRRVGKTELIVQFCQEKRAIFFVSDLGSEISLRAAFSTAINAVLFGPGRMDAVYSSWEALFQTLGQAAQEKRLVVVIDEFPIHGNSPPTSRINPSKGLGSNPKEYKDYADPMRVLYRNDGRNRARLQSTSLR
jgi:hypothetical protein